MLGLLRGCRGLSLAVGYEESHVGVACLPSLWGPVGLELCHSSIQEKIGGNLSM